MLHLLHERERESCYDGEQYLLNICTFCLLLKKRNPTELLTPQHSSFIASFIAVNRTNKCSFDSVSLPAFNKRL